LKRLKDIRNDFNFTFVGNYHDHQRKLAYDLGISDDIVFRGELNHAEVAMTMQHSDILVLFSRVENLPCVILEGWACGIPVVSTNVGGIHEWVNESNGILIKSGDEEALLKALIYMLDHLDRFDKNIMRQYAVDHFSQQAISNQFYTIYEKAVKNNG
jgi:glycosyltransferase involved in cell wall biosynthesis